VSYGRLVGSGASSCVRVVMGQYVGARTVLACGVWTVDCVGVCVAAFGFWVSFELFSWLFIRETIL
jgi:hypothetical protein